jgi:hypothetical protein
LTLALSLPDDGGFKKRAVRTFVIYVIIVRFKGALATILTQKIICFRNW